jgi:hypothetical protein
MKHLADALKDFCQTQDDQHRALCSRPRRSGARHRHHRRRLDGADPVGPPVLATHDPAQHCISGPERPPQQHTISYLALQDNGFPTAFLPTTFVLAVDTGASITITPNRVDFVSPIRSVQPTVLQGIGAGLSVRGIGTVVYCFQRDSGDEVTVQLENTLYVPDCGVRLLCPRHLAASTGFDGDGFVSLKDSALLRCFGHDLPVKYHSTTGLPLIYSISTPADATALFGATSPTVAAFGSATTSIASTTSSLGPPVFSPSTLAPNLTSAQPQKLLMHQRCNHRNMADINQWIRKGLLPVDPSIANCPNPICAACQFGKAHRKRHAKVTGGITAASAIPGDGVSADQLEAGCPGCLPTTKGLPTSKRYRY